MRPRREWDDACRRADILDPDTSPDVENEAGEALVREYYYLPDGPQKMKARDQVAAAFFYLIRKTFFAVGWHSMPTGTEYGDFVGAGTIALFEAVRAYSPESGAEFRTYAISAVRHAMYKLIQDASWCRSARKREWAVTRAQRELQAKLGRPPKAKEVAAWIGVTEEELREMIVGCQVNYPLSLGGGDGDRPEDSPRYLEPQDPTSLEDLCERREAARRIVEAAREILSHKELQVFYLLSEQCTPAEIAALFSMESGETHDLVRRIRSRIRRTLSDRGLAELYEEWAGIKRKRVHRGRHGKPPRTKEKAA